MSETYRYENSHYNKGVLSDTEESVLANGNVTSSSELPASSEQQFKPVPDHVKIAPNWRTEPKIPYHQKKPTGVLPPKPTTG